MYHFFEGTFNYWYWKFMSIDIWWSLLYFGRAWKSAACPYCKVCFVPQRALTTNWTSILDCAESEKLWTTFFPPLMYPGSSPHLRRDVRCWKQFLFVTKIRLLEHVNVNTRQSGSPSLHSTEPKSVCGVHKCASQFDKKNVNIKFRIISYWADMDYVSNRPEGSRSSDANCA